MAGILDYLAAGVSERAFVHVVGNGPPASLASVWHEGVRASGWFRNRFAADETVGMLIDASRECLSALVGAWVAGLNVASLPHREAAESDADWALRIAGLCADAGARALLADRARLDRFPPLPVAAHPVEEAREQPSGRERSGGGNLIQFSSGTTGRPKGVILTPSALAANVDAIIDVFENGEPMTTVSWLPLSHDMGLIGLFLAPWSYTARTAHRRGDIVLIPTESFMRSPSIWLRTCSEFRAHATCAPNFALDVVSRRLSRRPDVDLSSLRAMCVGAEPVRATTLRRFVEAASGSGFDERALCPAYGLAEAGLAVTCVRPDEDWRSVGVDAAAFGQGRWQPATEGTLELVSVGRPVLGTDVRIGTDHEIEVRSPSLLAGYTGDRTPAMRDGGWLATGDTGAMENGELFVSGRIDDLLVVGGRNVYATEIERLLADVPGLRSRNCVLLPDETGRYVVLVERRVGSPGAPSLREAARQVGLQATKAAGCGPSRVMIVPPGSFPKTANGKIRRSALRAAYWAGDLDVDWESGPGARRERDAAES